MRANDAVFESHGVGFSVTQVLERSTEELERGRGGHRRAVGFYRTILLDVILSLPLWCIIIWLLS